MAGKFRWLPSFAGGICLGRLEYVSCLDGHLLTFSITHRVKTTQVTIQSRGDRSGRVREYECDCGC